MQFQSAYHFPHPNDADPDGYGMVAVGGDLTPTTLLHAYSSGLFPWFNEGEPIAWWSPDPRCVVNPSTFSPKKSLKKTIKKSAYWLSVNLAFEEVISHCAKLRSEGTWITDDMINAYCTLNDMGFAHSIEVWSAPPVLHHAQTGANHSVMHTTFNPEAELIGGLYGLNIGDGFFGESMFHTRTDCSKIAFTFLNKLALQSGIKLIDCQLENPHLMSLGAMCISRDNFLETLANLIKKPHKPWKGFSELAVCFPVTSLLDEQVDYVSALNI